MSEQFITVVLLFDTVVIHKYNMCQLLFKGDHSHQHSQKGNSIKSNATSVPAFVFNSCKKQCPTTWKVFLTNLKIPLNSLTANILKTSNSVFSIKIEP